MSLIPGDESDHAAAPVFLSSDRLASLSDTMFGVAMTLVATTLLPAFEANHGSAVALLAGMNGELSSVVLSFAISALYWVGQQQRLAMIKSVTRRETYLNLAFLFFIVLVPLSTSLPELTGPDAIRASVLIYGLHLIVLSLVNLLLWIEVRRRTLVHIQIVRSSVALGVLILALAAGAIRPSLALYFWIAAPASASLARRVAGR